VDFRALKPNQRKQVSFVVQGVVTRVLLIEVCRVPAASREPACNLADTHSHFVYTARVIAAASLSII
jgi:hypothetical protein